MKYSSVAKTPDSDKLSELGLVFASLIVCFSKECCVLKGKRSHRQKRRQYKEKPYRFSSTQNLMPAECKEFIVYSKSPSKSIAVKRRIGVVPEGHD